MPVEPLAQRDRGPAVCFGRQRAAGDQPAADPAGDILQLVTVFVARHENEHDQDPERQRARHVAKRCLETRIPAAIAVARAPR